MKMKNCFIAFLSKKEENFFYKARLTWYSSHVHKCDLVNLREFYVQWRWFLIFKLLEFCHQNYQIKSIFNWTQWFLKRYLKLPCWCLERNCSFKESISPWYSCYIALQLLFSIKYKYTDYICTYFLNGFMASLRSCEN